MDEDLQRHAGYRFVCSVDSRVLAVDSLSLCSEQVSASRVKAFKKRANVLTVGVSLERIQQYLTIEQEPKPTKSGIPPAYWPASGDLRVEKLSTRYSQVSHLNLRTPASDSS